jgi:hypothetical protein
MNENIGQNFSPWNIYAWFSTTVGAIYKRISWLDSAPQTGPERTLKGFLILVGTWSTDG